MVDSSPPPACDTLIIGAGIVGCSTAYHLARRGRENVAVLDQGEIPGTGGSTVHAPGGVSQGGPNKTLAEFAKESRELYMEVDGFRERGAIDIAADDDELDYLRLRADYAASWGIDTRLLSPAEVGELNPDIDTSHIAGALHIPSGGSLRTFDCLDGLRESAEEGGISFHERTRVTDIEVENGAVEAVHTDRGRIKTDAVLVAANIWSPLIGEMVGVDVPLVPCEHQYVLTEPVAGLAGGSDRQYEGGFLYRRGSIYAGPQGDGYGIGNYNHDPLPVDPSDIDSYEEALEHPPVNEFYVGDESRQPDSMRMPASREFTPGDFSAAWEHATDVVPALEGAQLQEAFNGMFCFTPDGMPILGPSADVEGFWVAAAVWVTHAGGVGKAMAQWLDGGYPEADVSGCHIERFQPHERTREYVWTTSQQTYRNTHDIDSAHPRAPLERPRNVRRTPFYGRQADLGAEFAAGAGWERPRWYGSNEHLLGEYEDDIPDRSGWEARHWSPIEGAEHLAVRDGVGMYDLTPLTHIEISGADAPEYVQRLFPANLDTDVGTVTYTPLLNGEGGILGDMTVVRRGRSRFLVLANGGGGGTQQLAWLRAHVREGEAVTIRNRVHDRCGIGVWGPDARTLLESATDASLGNDAFPYFTAREFSVGTTPVLGLRISYVGELGWELHTPMEYGQTLWDTLWEAGQEYDIVPMGDGALKTMRLEKGYRIWNADINNAFDPYEAGLGFAVDLDTEFVGRDALLKAREHRERERTLSPLTLDDTGAVVLSSMPIYDGEETIGYTTSGEYGYSVGSGIAYGYLPPELAMPGTELAVRYRGERYPATVREEPLFDPGRDRIQG